MDDLIQILLLLIIVFGGSLIKLFNSMLERKARQGELTQERNGETEPTTGQLAQADDDDGFDPDTLLGDDDSTDFPEQDQRSIMIDPIDRTMEENTDRDAVSSAETIAVIPDKPAPMPLAGLSSGTTGERRFLLPLTARLDNDLLSSFVFTLILDKPLSLKRLRSKSFR